MIFPVSVLNLSHLFIMFCSVIVPCNCCETFGVLLKMKPKILRYTNTDNLCVTMVFVASAEGSLCTLRLFARAAHLREDSEWGREVGRDHDGVHPKMVGFYWENGVIILKLHLLVLLVLLLITIILLSLLWLLLLLLSLLLSLLCIYIFESVWYNGCRMGMYWMSPTVTTYDVTWYV